jgi:FMN phosphatase YigB (HAD superfamily)
MKQKPYLLFDAGGTLVFPDFKFMADIAREMDIETNPDELFSIHCNLIKELDTRTYSQMKLVDPFPNGYAKTLFAGILTNEEQKSILSNQIRVRDRHKSLWTATYPWVEKTINTLKTTGYSMSVISNSDGRVAKILSDLNLSPYFDMIFDSEIIGFSKPDIRLFEFALNKLSLNIRI